MKYGLVAYDFSLPATNIGNEIQTLAAAQFLPRIDKFFYFLDFSRDCVTDEHYKLIFNGYWFPDYFLENNFGFSPQDMLIHYEPIHRSPRRPPEKIIQRQRIDLRSDIEFLPVSIHFQPNSDQLVVSPDVQRYLNAYGGGVGARDIVTAQIFNAMGVKSYFSGCLTLTLCRNKNISKGDYIIVSGHTKLKRLFPFVVSKTKRPVYDLSDYITSNCGGAIENLVMGESMLDLLQGAHCVVTSRLHTALPALALGAPVLFVYSPIAVPDYKGGDINSVHRLSGLAALLNTVEENYYYANYSVYDVDNPPPNKPDYLRLRQGLIERCAEFMGEDNSYPGDNGRVSVLDKIKGSNASEVHANIFKTNVRMLNDKLTAFRNVTMYMNSISGFQVL